MKKADIISMKREELAKSTHTVCLSYQKCVFSYFFVLVDISVLEEMEGKNEERQRSLFSGLSWLWFLRVVDCICFCSSIRFFWIGDPFLPSIFVLRATRLLKSSASRWYPWRSCVSWLGKVRHLNRMCRLNVRNEILFLLLKVRRPNERENGKLKC